MSTATEDATRLMIEVLEDIDKKIESAIETLEILSDKDTLEGIEEGLRDIKEGDVISFEDFLKKHGYK
ncbi:MAG: hypothetical protein QMC85_04730 [Methanocellales archaeon]|nr:hypothetical protein [Methanocellales archaeon]